MKHMKTKLEVSGYELWISNPDKPMWPEQNITKAHYLHRLLELSPYLLRYCSNRYMTTIRYPHGAFDKGFYQKNAPEPIPPFVKTAEWNGVRYVNVDHPATLLWLGNLGALEFHPSFQYIGAELPAEWILDVDPSLPNEPRLMEAVLYIGEALQQVHIQSIPKTSGATGVQMFIPIEHGYTFEQLRSVGKFIAQYLVERHPDLFTIERLKRNRGNRIYLDYVQHWLGKSLSAPYTPRARKIASVSTPLHWDEVEANVHPEQFHLDNILPRLARTGDLIEQLPKQNLSHVLSFLQGS